MDTKNTTLLKYKWVIIHTNYEQQLAIMWWVFPQYTSTTFTSSMIRQHCAFRYRMLSKNTHTPMEHTFPLTHISHHKYSSYLNWIAGWILSQWFTVIKEIDHHKTERCWNSCNYHSFCYFHPPSTDISGGNTKQKYKNFVRSSTNIQTGTINDYGRLRLKVLILQSFDWLAAFQLELLQAILFTAV